MVTSSIPPSEKIFPIQKKIKWFGLGFIILFQFLMHFNHFSSDLVGIHVWRQTQTQARIDSFYAEDFNILNPRKLDRGDGSGIFRKEFPLVQWTIAGVYKLVGNQLIVTRICMFIISMVSMIGLFLLLLSLLRAQWAALIGAWAFSLAPAIFYHGINPMPDIAALCFINWGLFLFVKWAEGKQIKNLILSALLFGLATAIKLPFIVLYLIPAVYVLQQLNKHKINNIIHSLSHGVVYLLFLIPAAIWYINVIPTWGKAGVVSGLIHAHDSSSMLLHYAIHNVISTLPELLLNWGSVLFFITGLILIFFKSGLRNKLFIPFLIGGIGVSVYYIFELNMIQDKHDYYAFPFVPFLFIAVGCGIRYFLSKSKTTKYIAIACAVAMPLLTYARKGHAWNQEGNVLVEYKTELQNAIPNEALCIAGNDESTFIYFYHLNKKGWSFNNDELPASRIAELKEKGAKYLYSDSDEINYFVETELSLELIAKVATFRIYKL